MTFRRTVAISYGRYSVPLAAPKLVEAFFGTLSYRLEPQGRGTLFPLIMDCLCAGRLKADRLQEAINELDVIAGELRYLPVHRVVCSQTDLRRFNSSGHLVNTGADCVHDYFITGDRKPLVAVIRAVLVEAVAAGQDVVIETSERYQAQWSSIYLIAFGTLLSLSGYLLFRDYVLVIGGSESNPNGPLIWPMGLLIVAFGIVSFLQMKMQRFNRPSVGKNTLEGLISLAIIILWCAITWRG